MAMGFDKQTIALFTGASLLRLLLFALFPSLPALLTSRVELSTPVTNFKRRTPNLRIAIPMKRAHSIHSARRPVPLHS